MQCLPLLQPQHPWRLPLEQGELYHQKCGIEGTPPATTKTTRNQAPCCRAAAGRHAASSTGLSAAPTRRAGRCCRSESSAPAASCALHAAPLPRAHADLLSTLIVRWKVGFRILPALRRRGGGAGRARAGVRQTPLGCWLASRLPLPREQGETHKLCATCKRLAGVLRDAAPRPGCTPRLLQHMRDAGMRAASPALSPRPRALHHRALVGERLAHHQARLGGALVVLGVLGSLHGTVCGWTISRRPADSMPRSTHAARLHCCPELLRWPSAPSAREPLTRAKLGATRASWMLPLTDSRHLRIFSHAL